MDKVTVFLGFFVTILLVTWRFGQITIKPKSVRKIDTIPYIYWTGINYPLIDGFIGLFKIRTEGLAVIEKHVADGLKFAKCTIGPKTVYCVADTEIIQKQQKILHSTNEGHLHKPGYLALYKPTQRWPFFSNVSTWIPHRKAAALAFTYKSLGIYLQFINQNAKDLLHNICSQASQFESGSIHTATVSQLLSLSLLQLTTQIIMGSEYAAFCDHENRKFQNCFQKSKDITVERFLNPILQVPPSWWLHPKRRQLNAALAYMHSISVQYRVTQDNPEETKRQTHCSAGTNDLIKNKIETENEDTVIGDKPFGCVVEQLMASGLPDKEIILDEVATFLSAGHEAVNVALNMLMFHLALYLDIQKKCQVGIDQLFGGDVLNDRDFTISDLSSLKFLERCIFESLRLTPTFPFSARELLSSLDFSNDCTLDAGSIILVAVWGVHRDPAVYPNPDVFNPDRVLAENVRKRHPYSFIPFSMGPRNCIGWKLALMEMKVFMASILRNFTLTTTDGMNDVKILFDVSIHPERPYNVNFERRVY